MLRPQNTESLSLRRRRSLKDYNKKPVSNRLRCLVPRHDKTQMNYKSYSNQSIYKYFRAMKL